MCRTPDNNDNSKSKVILEKAESIAPRFYSLGGSSNLQLRDLAGIFNLQISHSPGRVTDLHLTQCAIGPRKSTCQMACNYAERFKQGGRQTYRRTVIWEKAESIAPRFYSLGGSSNLQLRDLAGIFNLQISHSPTEKRVAIGEIACGIDRFRQIIILF